MKKFAIIFLLLGLSISVFSQTKSRKPAKKTTKSAPVIKATPKPEAIETVEPDAPQKKNSRDESTPTVTENRTPQKKNQAEKSNVSSVKPEPKYNYYYEFTQKEFLVRHIVIEHDDSGNGKITFEKKDFDEPVTDPIQLSPASLEKIKTLFQTLNFVDATEAYQSTERDYAHLGTMKIRRKMDGKERTVTFNWTENKDARALAEEYRKIAQQYVWQFDMSVARANQPLEAPGLMDALEGYLRRKEISDPPQMLPLLKELSNDERIPLMARNHATKIIKQIEKPK
ncbi:MAG TPA: hypothetical protein VF599_11385 [Pyrinomonadaceae bacterium]|jgi:hypothetical protein